MPLSNKSRCLGRLLYTFTCFLGVIKFFTLSNDTRTGGAIFFCFQSVYTYRAASITLLLSTGGSSLCSSFFYHCLGEITLVAPAHTKEVGKRKPPLLSGSVCFLSGFPGHGYVCSLLLWTFGEGSPSSLFSFVSILFPSFYFPLESLFHNCFIQHISHLNIRVSSHRRPTCLSTLQASLDGQILTISKYF